MNQSGEINLLAKALVEAQADIRAVEKSAVNPHFKSKYVPLDAIIAMARPVLAQHGLTVVQAGTPFDDGKGLLVETRLIHQSGQWLSGVVYIPFGKADPQGAGAAMTYGRRFGLSALLSISSDEDDDGNAATKPKATAKPAAQSSAAPARAGFVDQTKVLPFGKSKGTPIADMAVDALSAAVEWAKANKPEAYAKFIDAAELSISEREAVGV